MLLLRNSASARPRFAAVSSPEVDALEAIVNYHVKHRLVLNGKEDSEVRA